MSRIHCIEHAAHEAPGRIADWVVERGHSFATTRVYHQEPFPGLDAFDALVVMGGPMGVHDGARFAWLTEEKRLIEAAMQADKRVLGVCLGSQLIADVLGVARGLLPAVKLVTSLVYAFAGLSVVVFLFAFHQAQS